MNLKKEKIIKVLDKKYEEKSIFGSNRKDCEDLERKITSVKFCPYEEIFQIELTNWLTKFQPDAYIFFYTYGLWPQTIAIRPC